MMRLRSDMPVASVIGQLEETIPQLMERSAVAGFSVTLMVDAEVIWSQGFGFANQDSRALITPGTVFEVGSLSKPVFAYAILNLCAQGVLDLDTSLASYLSEPYLVDDLRSDRITARHVLSHMSGLPNWHWAEQPLKTYFPPGQRFSYSGEGYVYLQYVVEQITRQPGAGFLQRGVLTPLGMSDSSFIWLDRYEEQAARGYDTTGEPVDKWKPARMNAAASLHSTPTDFARFMLAVMQSRYNIPSRLDKHDIAQMLTPQVAVNDDAASWVQDWPRTDIRENQGLSWGLGWGVQHTEDGDAFWHWGANSGYKALAIGSVQQRVGMVMMSNSHHGHRIWRDALGIVTERSHPCLDWIESLSSLQTA